MRCGDEDEEHGTMPAAEDLTMIRTPGYRL
jgi:hypothetical protein